MQSDGHSLAVEQEAENKIWVTDINEVLACTRRYHLYIVVMCHAHVLKTLKCLKV